MYVGRYISVYKHSFKVILTTVCHRKRKTKNRMFLWTTHDPGKNCAPYSSLEYLHIYSCVVLYWTNSCNYISLMWYSCSQVLSIVIPTRGSNSRVFSIQDLPINSKKLKKFNKSKKLRSFFKYGSRSSGNVKHSLYFWLYKNYKNIIKIHRHEGGSCE